MHYDYVDIGTSNFDTSADLLSNDKSLNILLVEPLDFYLNYFKGNNNIKLCNCAISDESGSATIYFLPEEYINQHFTGKKSKWLRGCNSINNVHPLLIKEIQNLGLDINAIQKKVVDKITFSQLCDSYNIDSIGRLKIDIEGHEYVILPSILQYIKNGMKISSLLIELPSPVIPNYTFVKIQFEKLITDFEKLGYHRTNYDMDVELSL